MTKDGTATMIWGYVGFMGDPFEVRDPTALVLHARLPANGSFPDVVSGVLSELQRLGADGLDDSELRRVQLRAATNFLRQGESVLARSRRLGVLELIHGDATLLNRIPLLISAVTSAQVQAAAEVLAENCYATAEIKPSGSERTRQERNAAHAGTA